MIIVTEWKDLKCPSSYIVYKLSEHRYELALSHQGVSKMQILPTVYVIIFRHLGMWKRCVGGGAGFWIELWILITSLQSFIQ